MDVDQSATASPDRDFKTTSFSAGLGWEASESLHFNLGLDRAQRAPTAEELYSSGLHVATGGFEFGNAALGVETAQRVELGMHLHRGPFELQLSAWQARYKAVSYTHLDVYKRQGQCPWAHVASWTWPWFSRKLAR